jgi:hypothetical protein
MLFPECNYALRRKITISRDNWCRFKDLFLKGMEAKQTFFFCLPPPPSLLANFEANVVFSF